VQVRVGITIVDNRRRMSDRPAPPPPLDMSSFTTRGIVLRSLVGGMLMGMANLVPGISGGTMLLAVGIYPQFIGGVAEVSTLRLRPRVLLMLGVVVASALGAIGGFARLVGFLLDSYEWAMYALFIGLTLGGVPLLWRMVRPPDLKVAASAAVAIAFMALLALVDPGRAGGAADRGLAAYGLFFVAGAAGGSAMILPGVSGAYLLLVLGQYRTIVGAVATAVDGLRAADVPLFLSAMHVFVPVGVGVVAGVVGVSNAIRALLARYQRATLGFLLGLLLGAVIGLWPFATHVPPRIGDVVRGVELTTPEAVAAVDAKDYRRLPVAPTAGKAAGALAFVALGFATSWAVSRMGARH
jgi:putative membrane protein